MDIVLSSTGNPLLNKAIDDNLKDILEQKIGTPSTFKTGAIYVHENSIFIAGLVFEVQGNLIWIDSLWVDPQFQGKGLGSKLIDRLVNFGEEQGCQTLQLNTYFADLFFRKVGFIVISMIPKWKFDLDCYFMRRNI
jgi:GNAT superfamily N-acetyltransferase